MGGSDSLLGLPISLDEVQDAIVVDCAGDLRADYRRRAGVYIPRVIMDSESRPFALHRLEELAVDLAGAVCGTRESTYPRRPGRIYVLCQYGMNRSGLMTGLLLRALGEAPADIVDLIRRLRPGSLSNGTFVSLIREWQPLVGSGSGPDGR